MFCKNCGKQIADDSKFCLYCGTKLFDDDATGGYSAPSSSQNDTYRATNFSDSHRDTYKEPEDNSFRNTDKETYKEPEESQFDNFDYREEKRSLRQQRKDQRRKERKESWEAEKERLSDHKGFTMSYEDDDMPGTRFLTLMHKIFYNPNKEGKRNKIALIAFIAVIVWVIYKAIVLKITG